LFHTATAVHTGWQSCIEELSLLGDVRAVDTATGNYCRLVEQEIADKDVDGNDGVWRDWTLEIRVGKVYVTGHWSVALGEPPMDWDWCAKEAEKAFEKACVLFGKRAVRVYQVMDDPGAPPVGGGGGGLKH